MRKWLAVLAIYIVCSPDEGLTRTYYENAINIFFSDGCLIFNADKFDHQLAACDPKLQCVIVEGTVPPPGTDLRDPKDK